MSASPSAIINASGTVLGLLDHLHDPISKLLRDAALDCRLGLDCVNLDFQLPGIGAERSRSVGSPILGPVIPWAPNLVAVVTYALDLLRRLLLPLDLIILVPTTNEP